MSRPKGSIIGARPTWTTTATSGIWTLRQAEEMKTDGKWPRGPVAPTSLEGTGSDGEVALTWVAPATTHGTITDYVVEYTPAAGSPTVVATGSTAASYTLTGLTNGTEYTIRVAAVNHTRGDWSDSVAVTPSGAPIDPYFANVGVLLHMEGANGATTFEDSSPVGIDSIGSFMGGLTDAVSKFGSSSASMTGDFSSIRFGNTATNAPGTGDFTLEFWIQPSYISQEQDFTAGFFGQNGPYLRRVSTTNDLRLRLGNGSTVVISSGNATSVIPSGQWTHVAMSRASGTLYIFAGGVLLNSVSLPDNFGAPRGVGAGLSDDGANGTERAIRGNIDEIRYTKGVARYTANFTPPAEPFPDA